MVFHRFLSGEVAAAAASRSDRERRSARGMGSHSRALRRGRASSRSSVHRLRHGRTDPRGRGAPIHPARPDPVLISRRPMRPRRARALESPAGSLHLPAGSADPERWLEPTSDDGRAQQARADRGGHPAARRAIRRLNVSKMTVTLPAAASARPRTLASGVVAEAQDAYRQRVGWSAGERRRPAGVVREGGVATG